MASFWLLLLTTTLYSYIHWHYNTYIFVTLFSLVCLVRNLLKGSEHNSRIILRAPKIHSTFLALFVAHCSIITLSHSSLGTWLIPWRCAFLLEDFIIIYIIYYYFIFVTFWKQTYIKCLSEFLCLKNVFFSWEWSWSFSKELSRHLFVIVCSNCSL